MTAFSIRIFGDPVLRVPAKKVTEIDGGLARLVATMYVTMDVSRGAGLAAPQVGVQKQLFTYDVGDGPQALINPEIVDQSGECAYDEGCLSIPGFYFEIVRPERVTMSGLDSEGNAVVVEADDILSRVLQHELDHLNGTLMLDRLDPDERKKALKQIREQDLSKIQVPRGRRHRRL